MNRREALEILALDPSASDDDVEQAFRELTKEYHPDLNDGNTRRRWIQIKEARDTLLERRSETTSGSERQSKNTGTGTTENRRQSSGREDVANGNQESKAETSNSDRSYQRSRREHRERHQKTGYERTQQTGGKETQQVETGSLFGSLTTAGLAVCLFPGILVQMIVPWWAQIVVALLAPFFLPSTLPWVLELAILLAIIFWFAIGGMALLGLVALGMMLEGNMAVAIAMTICLAVLVVYYWVVSFGVAE